MRLLNPLVAFITLLATILGFAATARGGTVLTEIDGRDADHVQFPYSEAAAAFRPRDISQKSLTIDNYYIHDLVNQKGLDIRASTQPNGAPAWAYDTITVKNSTFRNIERDEGQPGGAGLHIDFIRVAGGGNNQTAKMNVLIENVVIDGGDALPILFTDGTYGTVTLRNVVIRNTTLGGVQFKTDKVGSVDKIVIDNSPGLGVALIGRPGSIGEVLVRNSPDIRLGDGLNNVGTGAVVSFIDAANDAGETAFGLASSSTFMTPAILGGKSFTSVGGLPNAAPVPEPATLSLIALGAITRLARRRGH